LDKPTPDEYFYLEFLVADPEAATVSIPESHHKKVRKASHQRLFKIAHPGGGSKNPHYGW
jgi:hypothetical protein